MASHEGNLHVLPGVHLKNTRGVVDPEIIDALEMLLADAKNGILRVMVYGALTCDGMMKTNWVGDGATSNETHGVISLLAAEFAQARLRQQEEDR